MDHNRIENQLSAYLDDQLSSEKRVNVDAHLNTCDGCAEMLADFQQNRQRIGELEHKVPPIADLILPQLRDLGPVQRKFLPNAEDLRWWFFRPVTGGMFALVSACLLFAFVYFNFTPASEDSLNLYLAMHTQHSVYHSSQSDGVSDSFHAETNTPYTSIEDDTDVFLEVYLGD